MSAPADDVIRLTGLRVRGRHGVLPEERAAGQDFLVDVALHLDTAPAARGDDLRRTVDYGGLAQRLAAVVAGEPVELIETLAARLSEVCLADPLVRRCEVTVHKPHAPVGLPFQDVSITLDRAAPGGAAVALGSNLGDRLATLQRGLDLLAAFDDLAVAAVSSVVETVPIGGPEGQPAYLNAVALVRTGLPPESLLGLLHVVEAACDRVRTERWGPRTLDLDLLAVGGVVRDDPHLTLPHPRAHARAFVLLPWAEVDPHAKLPGHGEVAALAAAVDRTGVQPYAGTLRLPA